MSQHIRGTLLPVLQREVTRYSPNSGFITEQEWRGFDVNLMADKAAAARSDGLEYSFEFNRGVASLATVDARGEYVIDIWEIGVNQVLASAFKNPRLSIPGSQFVDPMDVFVIAYAVENGQTLDAAFATLSEDVKFQSMFPGYATAPEPTLAAKRLWQRVTMDKSDSFFFDQYVLRHTTNVSNRYPYNIADTNKNCIYSQAQFYSEVTSGSLWTFPMPDAFNNVLTSNPVPTEPDYYMWGYLKGGSPRTTCANNRSNIVTEYKQFLWSLDEYDIAS